MRLLIIDDTHIIYNSIPSDVQGLYVVDYLSNDEIVSDIITLEAIGGVWHLTGNKNIQISLNNNTFDKAPLTPYTVYTIYFYIFKSRIH